MNLLLPKLSPVFMTRIAWRPGCADWSGYLHGNGVTAINEPGIMWDFEPWDLYQAGCSGPPIRRSVRHSWLTPPVKPMPGCLPRARRRRRAGSGRTGFVRQSAAVAQTGEAVRRRRDHQPARTDARTLSRRRRDTRIFVITVSG